MAGEIGNNLVRQAVRQSSRAIVDIEALEGKHAIEGRVTAAARPALAEGTSMWPRRGTADGRDTGVEFANRERRARRFMSAPTPFLLVPMDEANGKVPRSSLVARQLISWGSQVRILPTQPNQVGNSANVFSMAAMLSSRSATR